MELENQNMLVVGKKSAVKRSGNTLQDTANTTSSTVKNAHSIFHWGYACTHKTCIQMVIGCAFANIIEERLHTQQNCARNWIESM